MINLDTLKPGDLICFNNKAVLANPNLRWVPMVVLTVNSNSVSYDIPEGKNRRRHTTFRSGLHALSMSPLKNAAYTHMLKK